MCTVKSDRWRVSDVRLKPRLLGNRRTHHAEVKGIHFNTSGTARVSQMLPRVLFLPRLSDGHTH